jgi:hypothetical protein
MEDLQVLLTRVANPEVRELAEEAWTCYNADAIRSSITATWTAVTTDIINKLIQLADDGDAQAVSFRTTMLEARSKGLSADGVRAMQRIEDVLLSNAAQFELIDSIDQRDLERIREDRNLCVHPSLRMFGAVYQPRAENARAHLAAALSTLLTHPATQGAKALDTFRDYTCDPGFIPVIGHIQTTFYDRVRANARRNIAKMAAKHALLELDPDGRLSAVEYANRCAVVLQAFAQRDREMVRSVVVAQRERFQTATVAAQRRALIRMGEQDYFWDLVEDTLAARYQEMLFHLPMPGQPSFPLVAETQLTLAMVRSDYVRARLPQLERIFKILEMPRQMSVAAIRPAPFYVPWVIRFLQEARNFRIGEEAGQLLVHHAPYLDLDTLERALSAWASNSQCRQASQMPGIAVVLYLDTAHLGGSRDDVFVRFLAAVQAETDEEGDPYRYPELETELRAAGALPPTP